MNRVTGTNLIEGSVLVDWNNNNDMPLHIEWDATGLFNAIDRGLTVGNILSGTNLYYDANGNGVGDAGEWVADIGSGNSMYVTGVSAVPLPPALWLMGSGLIGLLGLARRRHTR